MLVPVSREKVRPHCFKYADKFRAYNLFEEHLALLELHVKQSEHASASPRIVSQYT